MKTEYGRCVVVYRRRIAAIGLIATTVFTVFLVWGLNTNSGLHHEFRTQLVARVLHVSPKWEQSDGFLGIGCCGYLKHTKDEIEVIAQNGQKWYYQNVPMSAAVKKGEGIRVWVANNDFEHGGAIFEKEYVKDSNGEEKIVNTPYNSLWSIVGIALFLTAVSICILLAIFWYCRKVAQRRGGGASPTVHA